MEFTQLQIQAAKNMAQCIGIQQSILDEQAILFLEWYYSQKTDYPSEQKAASIGLAGLLTTGEPQMKAAWENILQGSCNSS